MANGILDTSIPTIDIDKIEKASGSTPGKARLTGMTITTLRYNIRNGYIVPAMERFNAAYAEVRRDVVADEVRAAENEMLATAGLEGYSEKELQLIRESNMVTLLSSPEIVNPKLSALNVSLVNAEGLFPRRKGNNIVAVTEKQYSPKALMVYSFLPKICKRIDNSYSVPVNTNHVSIDTPEITESTVSNWRSQFANVALNNQNEEVVDSSNKVESFPNVEFDDKVTKEDMTKRAMIAQIGSELAEIDRLLNGIASTTPFNQGLLERRDVLLGIFSNLTGVKTTVKKSENFIKNETTEFQQLIDEVSGYSAPLTQEQHEKLEEEFQEHYNDPDVIQNMNDLQLKNILFDLNKPEAHARVMAAERLDDANRAEKSVAIDLIDIESVPQNIVTEVSPKIVERKPLIEENENRYLKSQGELQAELLHAEKIKDDALKQAQALMKEELVVAGEEQARSLLKRSYEDAGLEQAQALMKEELVNAGEEQARSLLKRSYEDAGLEQAQALMKEELVVAGEEQARSLLKRSYEDAGLEQAQALMKEELVVAGEEQARSLLKRSYEDAGLEQAQALMKEELVVAGEEQARSLLKRNYEEAGLEQAQFLINEQLREAGKEQAAILAEEETIEYLKSAGKTQAQILFLENMKSYAEEQARMLNLVSVQESNLDKPYELFDISNRYASVVSLAKPLKVNSSQIEQIRSNYMKNVEEFNDFDDGRDMLVSLRAQLEDLGLGASEEEIGRTLVA